MAVKIRLRRTGKKKEAHYRVVVAEAQTARQGTFIETIGYVNPRTDPPQVRLDAEKARLWLERGAQPSDTVRDLLVRQGLLAKDVKKAGKAKSQVENSSPSEEVSADAGTDRAGSESAG
jgi:small subunit ribosomal protein S16